MSNRIITIGRQFGSGGHEIGDRLSRELGIPLYDKCLVEMAAEKLGMSESDVAYVDEKLLDGFLEAYKNPWKASNYQGDYGHPLSDQLFAVQSSIIQSLARKGPCIFVGRCADYILKDEPQCLNVFIAASMDDRIERIMKTRSMTDQEAQSEIKKVDRKRKSYYENYTENDWGVIDAHQMMFNVSRLGMDRVVKILSLLYQQL